MAVKNTLRIRFTFNRATRSGGTDQVQLTRKTDAFASTVINNIGVEVARGQYKKLKAQIDSSLRPAIERELKHLARQYQQFIVGNQRIGGTLTTTVTDTVGDARGNLHAKESVNLRSALPTWDRLAPRTLRQKQKLGLKNPTWFKMYGNLHMDAAEWEEMFGPIRISVQPVGHTDYLLKTTYRQIKRGEKLRVGVATIRASVFGMLTPREVSALATGKIEGSNQTADGRTSGLLAKVQAVNPQLAFRLGDNSKPNHKYRPSLEPFLAFAITRSVPTAVNHRLDVATSRLK